jgi:hypothetical protein
MVDLTAFAIFDVSGSGALDYMQKMTVNQMDVKVGRAVYTPLLYPNGGFKADLTIMRTGTDSFRIVTGGGDGGRGWRTCSISTWRRPTRSAPSSASTKLRSKLIGEARTPVPQGPGRPARIDYEYRRNGTANLFVFVDAHRAWRHVKVTDHRTNIDFAQCMRELVDCHYPRAERIRVVLDNLSTHRAKNLYEAFPPEEARRILRRLEFHYTPTHASWLNMVEIEISVLASQCLDRRIPDRPTLEREIAAWEERRNAQGARIKWMFDAATARRKLGKLYPAPVMSTTTAEAA